MNAPQTTVQPGDTIALRCALRANGGEVLANFDAPQPETVTLGDGALEPFLEACLVDLPVGERRVFDLGHAFGERDPELIRPVERRTIPAEQTVAPESLIEFEHQDGSPLPGVVIDVTPEHVVVDFNPPLAGMEIEFEVEVVRILGRAAQA